MEAARSRHPTPQSLCHLRRTGCLYPHRHYRRNVALPRQHQQFWIESGNFRQLVKASRRPTTPSLRTAFPSFSCCKVLLSFLRYIFCPGNVTLDGRGITLSQVKQNTDRLVLENHLPPILISQIRCEHPEIGIPLHVVPSVTDYFSNMFSVIPPTPFMRNTKLADYFTTTFDELGYESNWEGGSKVVRMYFRGSEKNVSNIQQHLCQLLVDAGADDLSELFESGTFFLEIVGKLQELYEYLDQINRVDPGIAHYVESTANLFPVYMPTELCELVSDYVSDLEP